MTTPGCREAFVGFLAAFAPRRQNQRGCPNMQFALSSFQSLPAGSASTGVTSSSVPSLSTFFANVPEHKLRWWSTTRMRGLPYDLSRLFLFAVLRVSPDWSRRGQNAAIHCPNTRCSWKMGCALRTCLRKTGEVRQVGERLTSGQAGRFCASQAPQLCLAAARMILRLAPSRRSTRYQCES